MQRLCAAAALLCACGPQVASDEDDGIDTELGSDAGTTGTGAPPVETTIDTADDSSGTGCMSHKCLDLYDPQPPQQSGQLDVLLVLDNSLSMAEEQVNVSRNLIRIVHGLQELTDIEGSLLNLDVHVMVTTTDFGSPLCPEIAGYEPAHGEPVTEGCNERILEFADPSGTRSVEEACTSVCPVDIVGGTSYVAFGPDGSNVPDVEPVDIDGDGELEDAAAQAIACIGAQGIIGCEYGSPLEAMLQALNPAASWNAAPDGFLREGAGLFVVIVTDEPDCSAADPSFVLDEAYMNVDPGSGAPAPSPASCWNAGVACEGPDANGVYASCASAAGPLHDVDRYVSYLEAAFEDRFLLGIVTGVPLVTMHNRNPPFEPIAGGVHDLVYRGWVDGAFPVGDILPTDAAAGVTAADQQFRFGIGPGCTTETAQATPPVRMRELCDAVVGDELPRCAIESICDDDFSVITRLLVRSFGPPFPPPG